MYIKESDLSETNFIETKIKNLELDNVNFSHTEIAHTPLKDVDFSTCKLDDIMIDNLSLQGIIIDRFQSHELVRMLGIKFKD